MQVWYRRTLTALLVVGLHAMVGALLLLHPVGRGVRSSAEPLPITLFAPEPSAVAEPPPEPPLQSFEDVVSLKPPRLDEEVTPGLPSSMALTVGGPEESAPGRGASVVVMEASDFDAASLRQACIAAYPATASDLELPGALTVLVRVEPSGRPSQTKIVRPSGNPNLDDAVSACLLSQGAFQPLNTDGHAVASWRRLIWSP